MNRDYKGGIVEESLTDNRVINDLKITSFRITTEENSAERWHIYKVKVSRDEIQKLAQNIKQGWYMHFWKGRNVIAVFKGKQFEFNLDDKKTWSPAIDYGLSIGIPKEQLDFPID